RRSYQLLSLVLSYALLLQIMPARSVAAANYRSTNRATRTDAKSKPVSKLEEAHASVEGATLTTSGATPDPQNSANLSTITDAVISRQRPNLNSGMIDGSLRVLQGASFTINGNTQITSDLFLPGSPAIATTGGSQYSGTVNDGGSAGPNDYTVTLS